MITYDILWVSIKKKGLKKQDLVEKYEFSKGLMDNLKHNRSITMTTLNDICNKLDLQPNQVFEYTKDNSEAKNPC